MKKLSGSVCLIVLAVFAGGSASADDFKGFYIGANGGGAHNESNAKTSTVFSPTGYFATTSVPAIATAGKQELTRNGFTGGGQAGYNYQRNRLVLGFETDFGGMSLSASKSSTATYPCCAPTAFTINQIVSTNWLFTARGRVGFAHGPVLVYGTGGLAMTNINYKTRFTDTFATAAESATVDSTQTGWIAGGGVEVRISHEWSLKGEFLHADFGSTSTTSTNLTAFTPPIAFPTNVFTHTTDLTSNIYRTGFNFRF